MRETVGVAFAEAGSGMADGAVPAAGRDGSETGSSSFLVGDASCLPISFTVLLLVPSTFSASPAFVLASGFPGVNTYAFLPSVGPAPFDGLCAARGAVSDLTKAFLSVADGSEAASRSSSIKSAGSLREGGDAAAGGGAAGSGRGGEYGICSGLCGSAYGLVKTASVASCSLAAMTLGGSGSVPLPYRSSSSSFCTYGEISSRGDSGSSRNPWFCVSGAGT